MIKRGLFITLEGGEGAGKSTQIKRLAAWLELAGITVVTTREPGGSPEAEEIRSLLVDQSNRAWDGIAEALLVNTARHMHVRDTILPALDSGAWVLCDRFYNSTTAYQGYGRGVDLAVLDQLRRIAIAELEPDLTIILDVDVQTGLTRAMERRGGETRFEQAGLAFHARLRAGFQALAATEPQRCVLVDANRPIEAIEASIQDLIERHFDL